MQDKIKNLATFIFVLLVPLITFGDATESSLQITATVAPACSITSSNLNFGPYNYAKSDETTTLELLCTNGTQFEIGINGGSNPNAAEGDRGMSSNNNVLKYSLFLDPNMRIRWGSDSPNSLKGSGTGDMRRYKIYGRILQNQKLPPGLYKDNLLVTVKINGLSGFGYQLSLGLAVAATIKP